MKNFGQIQPNLEIEKLASAIKSDGFDLIFDILELVYKKLKNDSNNPDKNNYFRKRTAAQILTSGIAYGCTDYALLTLSLLRAKKIKARYIEAFNKKWLINGGEVIEGHIFVEVSLNNKIYIINPEASCILKRLRHYEIYKKGTDSWAIGINNISDMKKVANTFRRQYLRNLKKIYLKNK